MVFRTGSYAKVWEVKPVNDSSTKLKISISRKNPNTQKYDQEFSDFVMCYGTATAKNAAMLSKGDTIKIGDVDVTNRYDAERKVTYTNYKIFSFEVQGSKEDQPEDPTPADVDSGEVESTNSRLPF